MDPQSQLSIVDAIRDAVRDVQVNNRSWNGPVRNLCIATLAVVLVVFTLMVCSHLHHSRLLRSISADIEHTRNLVNDQMQLDTRASIIIIEETRLEKLKLQISGSKLELDKARIEQEYTKTELAVIADLIIRGKHHALNALEETKQRQVSMMKSLYEVRGGTGDVHGYVERECDSNFLTDGLLSTTVHKASGRVSNC
jgi:hypothetical protein